MFSGMLNKAKSVVNETKQTGLDALDNGLSTVKSTTDLAADKVSKGVDTASNTVSSGVESIKASTNSAIDKSVESINSGKNKMDAVYEEKIKVFLEDNAKMVKEEAMKNELFARLMVEGLTVAVAIPIIATIVYNLLPGPIQFVVEEDTFVSFVDEHINLFIDILTLEIELEE